MLRNRVVMSLAVPIHLGRALRLLDLDHRLPPRTHAYGVGRGLSRPPLPNNPANAPNVTVQFGTDKTEAAAVQMRAGSRRVSGSHGEHLIIAVATARREPIHIGRRRFTSDRSAGYIGQKLDTTYLVSI